MQNYDNNNVIYLCFKFKINNIYGDEILYNVVYKNNTYS